MILIKVRAREAQFLDIKKPQPVVLFEVLKGMVTGKKPDLGRTQRARASEFPAARRRPSAITRSRVRKKR